MYPEKKFSNQLLLLLAGAFVVAIVVFFGFRSLSSSTTGISATNAAVDDQASTTVSQGLQLAAWLAKEYPADGK